VKVLKIFLGMQYLSEVIPTHLSHISQICLVSHVLHNTSFKPTSLHSRLAVIGILFNNILYTIVLLSRSLVLFPYSTFLSLKHM